VSAYEWSGGFVLGAPPAAAFVAFTPRGEQGWAPGWRPVFHGPADDDSAPGTVFEVPHEGRTSVWIVVDREFPVRVRYARSTPGVSAGTVTVRLRPEGSGSRVDVTYRMTALSAVGDTRLAAQAADPEASPTLWRDAVEGFLAG